MNPDADFAFVLVDTIRGLCWPWAFRRHWSRDSKPDIEEVVEKVSNPTTVAAVFDNKEAVEKFVQELRKADLGRLHNS